MATTCRLAKPGPKPHVCRKPASSSMAEAGRREPVSCLKMFTPQSVPPISCLPDAPRAKKSSEYLKKSGVTSIAITDGAEPIHFASDTISGTLRFPPVEAVDSMGAGDIFHGAYCFFASTGRGFVESLAEASAIAAESCRHRGAREWMSIFAGLEIRSARPEIVPCAIPYDSGCRACSAPESSLRTLPSGRSAHSPPRAPRDKPTRATAGTQHRRRSAA